MEQFKPIPSAKGRRFFTRVDAMKEWNALKGTARQNLTDIYYPGRKHNSLTGREIQDMYTRMG